MIVSTEDLPRHRGQVTMVDGGFDPFHHGHVAYFEAAAGLGLPVLCNVSSDEYVSPQAPAVPRPGRARGDHRRAPLGRLHPPAHGRTTEDVLRALQPRYYAKGADWQGRLPEAELAVCAENGTEVVYLDTVVDSSTAILERYAGRERAR